MKRQVERSPVFFVGTIELYKPAMLEIQALLAESNHPRKNQRHLS
jgi:hypothetical protein